MCKDEKFSISEYGYEEDLEDEYEEIDEEKLDASDEELDKIEDMGGEY